MTNVKQVQAVRMKMTERAQQKMDLHFPGWPDFWVWSRKRDAGYISIPRILPIAMQTICVQDTWQAERDAAAAKVAAAMPQPAPAPPQSSQSGGGRRWGNKNLRPECEWPTEVGHSNSLVSGGRLTPTSPRTHSKNYIPFREHAPFFQKQGLHGTLITPNHGHHIHPFSGEDGDVFQCNRFWG